MFLIPWLAQSSQPQASIWSTVALPVGFVVSSLWIGKRILPFLMGAVSKTGVREVFFFFVIALTLGMGWLAEQMGLSMALGAFLAGLLISESPYNKQALAELSPLRDIFLGFFFVSVGILLDLSFVRQHFLELMWLIPLLFGIKVLGTYWVIRAFRASHGIALGVALILAQIGEFSFLLAAAAKQHELIGETEFQYFLSLAVFSLLFSPLVVGWGLRATGHSGWSKLALLLRRQAPESDSGFVPNADLERRCFVIGLGHAGLSTLQKLQELGIPCTGIDFNMQNVERASKLGLDALFGDATRKEFLEEAGVENSFLVIVTVSGKHLVQELVEVLRHLRRMPQILVRTHFVQDLEELQHLSPQDIIVSEQTTTDAIVENALSRYQS
jgi:CPA2 family monovalent cation:H+ antiporter-2